MDRIPHVPARAEQREIDRGHTWGIPEFDSVANGRLTLRAAVPSSLGLRSRWSDGKQQRVEDCLNKFMIGLIKASLAIDRERERREAQAAEYRRREARRKEYYRQQREEQERVERLKKDIEAWKHAREVRDYVAALGAEGSATRDADASTWLRWVRGYADRIDPLVPRETE